MIERSSAEAACKVVFASKIAENIRFCVDYRRLNAKATRDSYTIPIMNECIDTLGDAEVFYTPNANSTYWQCEVEESDRDKMTITFHMELFCFLQTKFSIKKASVTFHRPLGNFLKRLKWGSALVHPDDFIIYFRSF